jgi:hypothetical protein
MISTYVNIEVLEVIKNRAGSFEIHIQSVISVEDSKNRISDLSTTKNKAYIENFSYDEKLSHEDASGVVITYSTQALGAAQFAEFRNIDIENTAKHFSFSQIPMSKLFEPSIRNV